MVIEQVSERAAPIPMLAESMASLKDSFSSR
jgi:hypothetical protein